MDKENAHSSPTANEQKAMSLMQSEHMVNLVKFITKKEISERFQRTEPEQKLKQRKSPWELQEFPGDIMAWNEGGQSAKNECLWAYGWVEGRTPTVSYLATTCNR